MHSPAARSRAATDDLISLLGPATVLAALRAPPPGPLKACLAMAALSEKDFALRTATASARVLEWLDEMQDWPWPAGPGSSGFEEPPARGRGRPSAQGLAPRDQSPPDGDVYWGSLPSAEVARLERRIDEISAEMEQLRLDEIKEQVMHNHILPMSRPTTPLSPSTLSYIMMDDLTAVVTAIVVQALPNIARLSRLLRVWAIRVAVLHGIPALLDALSDAEAALRVGWNAISAGTPNEGDAKTTSNDAAAPLSQQKFDGMRGVLEAKISKPGGHLDRMLDNLEGLEDTLPEAWLDRMEAVEKDFGDWVAAGGRIIREAGWASNARKAALLAPSPQLSSAVSDGEGGSVEGDVPRLLVPSDGDDDGDDDEEGGILLPPIHMGGSRRASDKSMDDFVADSAHSPPRLPRLRGGHHGSNARLSSPLRLGTGAADLSPGMVPVYADDVFSPMTPLDTPFDQIDEEDEDGASVSSPDDQQGAPIKPPKRDPDDDYIRQRIRRVLTTTQSLNQFSLSLAPEPASASTLNPPDLALPRVRKTGSREPLRGKRSTSSLASSRAQTPAYTLTPAPYAKGASQRRPNRGQQETRVYHLTRANGGPPIKLFIRVVGESGERVMVRVGGGWADLGEYLKEYAAHHGRRSTSTTADRVEIRDLPTDRNPNGTSPPRPSSAMDSRTPMTPLVVRKKRRGSHLDDIASPISRPLSRPLSRPGSPAVEAPHARPFSAPRTPGRSAQGDAAAAAAATRSSGPGFMTPASRSRSRASSRSWGAGNGDDDATPSSAPPVPPIPSIALGLAGPKGKEFEISDESRAWIESVQQKVLSERRAVSSGGSSAASGAGGASTATPSSLARGGDEFGDMGRVGGTKRVFRKGLLDDGRK
jgi:hypothetical protein